MSKRQITATEKSQVIAQQKSLDGLVYCFISGEAIAPDALDSYEFDHLTAWAEGGDSDVANVRAVLTKYNRQKGKKTLYEARDNYRLEKLFEEKKNSIKLQDIFQLKEIVTVPLVCHSATPGTVTIATGATPRTFATYDDPILQVPYFYARVPVQWLENDDQEGLQPRVIDYRRLVTLRNHLHDRPQLAPSIARLVSNRLKLFDGQHKLAAQVLNGVADVDIKVYVSPADADGTRQLFDQLMMTNLDAHSKLKQVPFYTSTLLDRLSAIYKELWDEFVGKKPVSEHTEDNFVRFLTAEKGQSRAEALTMLLAAIKTAALEPSALRQYVAEASRDNHSPMTQELLNKALYPRVLYLHPAKALVASDQDRRDAESRNFSLLADLLVEHSGLTHWVPAVKGGGLTNEQRKARRIWHKGSVLTWGPYLESILNQALQFMTTDEREQKLYRPDVTDHQKGVLSMCLKRLFGHPFWDDNDPAVDLLLASAQPQKDLFVQKGLTELYVLTGN